MRNVIRWDLNRFFSKNLQKSSNGWGLCPQTPIATGGWGLCPHTPVSDTFEYTSLLNMSSKLDFYTFQQLVFALSLYQILAKCHQATASDLPFYDIFAPQKITFSKISDDVIACDLWFGSPPPPIKNPGYACAQNPLAIGSPVLIYKCELLAQQSEQPPSFMVWSDARWRRRVEINGAWAMVVANSQVSGPGLYLDLVSNLSLFPVGGGKLGHFRAVIIFCPTIASKLAADWNHLCISPVLEYEEWWRRKQLGE